MIPIEVRINKEVRDYQESLFFGLSLRQLLFALLAVIVAVAVYFGLRNTVGSGEIGWICVLAAFPFALGGFFTYNGMTLERFILAFIRSEFLYPKRLVSNRKTSAQRPSKILPSRRLVKRIFQGVIEGKPIARIAEELTAERILTPAAHWRAIGERVSMGASGADPYKWATATLIQILKKEEYMGWTVLNKTATESYKSKKREATPQENRLIFKDTHPAIVDEETWNVVQRLRETKRVRERIGGEPNPLTGVLYCADCGQKMYHKQGSTGRPDQPHHEYVCSSYRHYSRSCTCHYIRVSVVESLVLEAIRRVSGYVRENEAEFIERVREKSELQQEAAVKESRKKLLKAKRRREEISGLIKKLYEAYATGKIPENHFSELLTGYDTEQKPLDGEIERLQAEIDRYNTDSMRADKFIELVKRHTEFTEFSASLLNEFVEKIIVHEATKVNGVREQEVEIYLNFIGKFDLPEQEEQPEETPVRKSRKKRRHEMTEEQRAALRERDKVRYARKVAARKAAEEAQRAAILKGTAYEIRPQEAGAAHAAI